MNISPYFMLGIKLTPPQTNVLYTLLPSYEHYLKENVIIK